jgi:succinate dehydrogenase / fumarate reductase, flavoprotein subunit
MRVYPAIHYTMGGLWVDYNLMSTIPGLFVAGEANFADQGANRLGASALMQGLADGYFILPYTIGNYLASTALGPVSTSAAPFASAREAVSDRTARLLAVGGTRTVDSFHRELGLLVWQYCGMARDDAGLRKCLDEIPRIEAAFWSDVRVLGTGDSLNQSLEKAGRVADYFELAKLMVTDALHRTESCGGHFREESQTAEGEALRDDDHFAYVAAWGYNEDGPPVLHREPLEFEEVHLTQRSYK